MANALDLEALLNPIDGENPAGENLKYSGLHDEIREARRADDVLPAGEYQSEGEAKTASWDDVVSLATDALVTKTKDLQVAAWLAEAVARRNGFTGVLDGLKLVRELLTRFWDNVYPEVDDGDMEGRANILAWLDRQLAFAAKECPVTRSPAFGYLKLEDARRKQKQRDSAEEGTASEEEFRKAEAATRRAFYEEIAPLVDASWEELTQLSSFVGQKFGNQAPALRDLKAGLDAVRTSVTKTLKEKRILEPDATDAPAEEGDGGETQTANPKGSSGSVTGRREALRKLQDVADYFKRNEPHSPVSYLVERAIRWGEMPLPEWLRDVVKDGATLDAVKETLGLKPPSSGEEG